MRPQILRDLIEQLATIEKANGQIAALLEEQSKLPSKPPELFKKNAGFKAAVIFIVLGIVSLTLIEVITAPVLQEYLRIIAIVCFITALPFLGTNLVLWTMRMRYEQGQQQSVEIEGTIRVMANV